MALPLKSHVISHKLPSTNIFFYKLKEMIKITSEVSFDREYVALGSKWITCMSQVTIAAYQQYLLRYD